jgi:hypothetical protein
MKLPLPFFQNDKEEKSEYYLALLLTDEKASAVILQEAFGKIKFLGKHEEFFTSTLEHANLEELTSIIDKTISRAEEVLPPDVQTHKTVFGVKETWVEPDTKKITKDNLSKLKKICDSLDLTPIGFMVVTEAISHLLQEEEGAPLSAILADIGRKSITLTLLRGGKAVERIDGPIEDSAPATVDTLLKHFTTAVLPARLILYDAKKAEQLSQAFIGHQWSKSLPFLHVPQITVLPAGFDAKAVTFGAATQMGLEVSGMDLKLPPPLSQSEEQTEKETSLNEEIPSKRARHHEAAPEDEEPEEKDEESEASEEEPTNDADGEKTEKKEAESTISGDNFGFVTDDDITKSHPQRDLPEPARNRLSEAMAGGEKPTHHTAATSFRVNLDQEENLEGRESDNLREPKHTRANPLAFLPMIKLPTLSMPALSGRKKFMLPIGILIGLLLFVFGISAYFNNSVQAHILLSVKPEIVTQDTTVTFSGTSGNDFSKKIIAAKPLETTVEGTMTIDTTGKKDVGNKAKGTVTVYNNANSSVKLENGSAIKSSNGVTFLLDKEVTISSASGDIFSGTKPGTADVAVSAKDIGTEGNLPSGTKFTVGSNSSLAAKNDSAFSGGSKKQVQVISKNDVAKLRAELPKSLEGKAKEAIAQKAGDDETVLPFISVVSLDKAKFDNDVDDEAKKVTLTASVKFEALAYENHAINTFAKSLLKEKYSQDISDKSIKYAITSPEENKDSVAAKLGIEAGLLPDIDTADVVSKVEKMSLKDAKSFLSGLAQVSDSKITFSPNIPLLPSLLPSLPDHISVEVKPE